MAATNFVISFYADAFFTIEDGMDPRKYVYEHWEQLVDMARYRLPEADYELDELDD